MRACVRANVPSWLDSDGYKSEQELAVFFQRVWIVWLLNIPGPSIDSPESGRRFLASQLWARRQALASDANKHLGISDLLLRLFHNSRLSPAR